MTLPRGYFSGKQDFPPCSFTRITGSEISSRIQCFRRRKLIGRFKKKIDGKGDPSGHENSAPVLHPMTKDDNFYELFSDLKDIGW